MSIKVMLADDHILMREGIRQLLEFDGSISVIEEAKRPFRLFLSVDGAPFLFTKT